MKGIVLAGGSGTRLAPLTNVTPVRVGFDEGIKLTMQWYLDHAKWITHAVSGEYVNYYEKKYGNEVNV